MAIQVSRFALLKIEDDFDSDEENGGKGGQKGGKKDGSQQNAKKKNKKNKKKTSAKLEDAELKSMAFGGTSAKPLKPHTNGHAHADASGGGTQGKQWEEWRKLDTEFTDETYERDLQQALLMSKLEQEEQKKAVSENSQAEPSSDGSAKNKKKKKKKQKDKPAAMSLEQFNQMSVKSKEEEDEGPEYQIMPSAPKPNTSLPKDAQPDKDYFKKVDQDVQKIIQQEHIQEEYRKQYAMGSVISAQYEREMEKRDQEIAQLRKDNKGLTDIMSLFQEELAQVKKRNHQLCHILAQGEMKDKAQVQLELENLQLSHQELSEQVTQLTQELEKERSKNHTLQAENQKLKSGKHK